jgi:hypothetical protein
MAFLSSPALASLQSVTGPVAEAVAANRVMQLGGFARVRAWGWSKWLVAEAVSLERLYSPHDLEEVFHEVRRIVEGRG